MDLLENLWGSLKVLRCIDFQVVDFGSFSNGLIMISVSWRSHKMTLYWFDIGFNYVSWKLILELSEGLRTYQISRFTCFQFCFVLLVYMISVFWQSNLLICVSWQIILELSERLWKFKIVFSSHWFCAGVPKGSRNY